MSRKYLIDPVFGSDAFDGYMAPKRTFSDFSDATVTLADGDQVLLKSGYTYRETFTMQGGGSNEATRVKIGKYGSGDLPIISGSDPAIGFYRGDNLLPNPSFENWTALAIDDWTIDTGGSSTVTEDTADPPFGGSCVKLSYDGSGTKANIKNTAYIELVDNTRYAFTVWHKDPDNLATAPALFSILLWRTDTPGSTTGEYLVYNSDYTATYWTSGDPPYEILFEAKSTWQPSTVSFDTGPNSKVKPYYYILISAASYVPFNTFRANKDFYFDMVSLGKISEPDVFTNIIKNSSFEDWTSSLPDEWDVDGADYPGECSVEEDDTSSSHGSSSVKLIHGAIEDDSLGYPVWVEQDLPDLGFNTTWRFTVRSKQDNLIGTLFGIPYTLLPAVLIYRTGGTYPEYLTNQRQWVRLDGVPGHNANGILLSQGLDWTTSEISIETGADDNEYENDTYHIHLKGYIFTQLSMFFKEAWAGTSLWFDHAVLKKDVTEYSNKLSNPSFENWTAGAPDNWTVIQEGETVVSQHNNERFGEYGISLVNDSDNSEMGISQEVTLGGSTTWRLSMFIQTWEEVSTSDDLELEALIQRGADGYYWNGSAWADVEAAAMSHHSAEWNEFFALFTTEAGSDDYTITIRRTAGTWAKPYEQAFIGFVSVSEEAETTTVYKIPFPQRPKHLFYSGELKSITVDHLQLHDATWDAYEAGYEDYPSIRCWTYNNVEKMLYANFGADLPDSYECEATVRNYGFDGNQNSWFELRYLNFYRQRKEGIHLGYLTSTPTQHGHWVKDCEVYYPGQGGITAGYTPTNPYHGAPDQDWETGYPPSNINILDNRVVKYSRDFKMRHVVAEDELITNGNFETWGATYPTSWTKYPGGSPLTYGHETDDVRIGDHCFKLTGAVAPAPGWIRQFDIATVLGGTSVPFFDDTSKGAGHTTVTSRTIRFYYKGPGDGTHFNFIIWRSLTSSGTSGDYLQADLTWGAGTAGITVESTDTKWHLYELEIPRDANWDSDHGGTGVYWFYNILFGVSDATVGEVYLMDALSISQGLTDWHGSSFRSQDCGITVRRGNYTFNVTGGLSYGVKIKRNYVNGGLPFLNANGGRQGIAILNGGFPDDDDHFIYVEDNYVTECEHGIAVMGHHSPVAYGNALVAVVRRNFSFHCGDDNLWIEGLIYPQNRVCYNILSGSEDNNLEVASCWGPEIYGNIIHNSANQGIWVNGEVLLKGSNAFIFNNVFYRWGQNYRTGNPGLRQGVAIGLEPSYGGSLHYDSTGGLSVIDNNIYWSPDDETAIDHPFCIAQDGVSNKMLWIKTWPEWQAAGFDEHSVLVDPLFFDPDTFDFRVPRSSPLIGSGSDLEAKEATIVMDEAIPPVYPSYTFGAYGVQTDAIDSRSTWPADVMTAPITDETQGWNVGPWLAPVPQITRGETDTPFPTDKSLYGVTVYVTDTDNHRIWKGVIIENTADVLYLDDWEPVFNADGTYPEGDYPYYVGWIYLYDKTPQFAFYRDNWEKGLIETELVTNHISTANDVFLRFGLNSGDRFFTHSSALLGDRTAVKITKGMNRSFQMEHAMVTNQAIQMRGMTYHVVISKGKKDQ